MYCIGIFCPGCNFISLDKAEPPKTYFPFDEIIDARASNKNKKILNNYKTMEFTAGSKFKGKQFIYKKNNQYIKDYYNRFFALPEKEIQNICEKWFGITGVCDSSPNRVLKGKILEIYCDRTNDNNPVAIIKIRFTIINFKNIDKIIMQKDFYSGVKFNNFTPENLVKAWSICLKQILKNLETKISQ